MIIKQIKHIRIATRKSALALWQANFVKQQLQQHYPSLEVSLVEMVTKGDILLDSPLSKIGGKGLFVKELEHALFNNDADIAVHSLKDVPMHLPEGLTLSCICKRQSPYDAFVSNDYHRLSELPEAAIVGTSSLRRQSQLLRLRPDLQVHSLRGNVNSRLAKLDAGEYQAIILAAAGLERLGFNERITQLLDINQSLPAVGQGAMAIETRCGEHFETMLSVLHHHETAICVAAERALNTRLNGGCQVPIAAFAQFQQDHNQINLQALVANEDGSHIIEVEGNSTADKAEQLGQDLALQLLDKGGREVLAEFGIIDIN